MTYQSPISPPLPAVISDIRNLRVLTESGEHKRARVLLTLDRHVLIYAVVNGRVTLVVKDKFTAAPPSNQPYSATQASEIVLESGGKVYIWLGAGCGCRDVLKKAPIMKDLAKFVQEEINAQTSEGGESEEAPAENIG